MEGVAEVPKIARVLGVGEEPRLVEAAEARVVKMARLRMEEVELGRLVMGVLLRVCG